MEKKDKKKNGLSGFGIIAIVLALMSSLADIMDGAAMGVIITAAVFIVVVLNVVKVLKKVNTAAKDKGLEYINKPADSVPQNTSPRTTVVTVPGRHVPKIQFTHEKNAYTPDNGDKYIAQLNGFLKNGIIERSEYNYLLKKYRNNSKKS